MLRPLAWIAALLVSFALPIGVARAQTEPPPSSVAFADDAAVAVDAADLGSGLPIRVISLAAGQTIKVSVELQPRDAFATGVLRPVTKSDAARGIEELTLPAGDLSGAVEHSYAGSIVALGATGPAVRQDITITTGVKAAATAPSTFPDVTLTATNYAPSFLSPLGPGLIVLGAVVLVAALALAGLLGPAGACLAALLGLGLGLAGGIADGFGDGGAPPGATAPQVLLFAGAGMLVLIGLFMLGPRLDRTVFAVCMALAAASLLSAGFIEAYGSDQRDEPAAAIVSVKSISVPDGAATGIVGRAASPEGDLVDLTVEDGELAPSGLARAGAFTGAIDLNGATAEGTAKASVHATDWWLWALLTIALGVVIGAAVRQWFERGRARAKGQRDLEAVWQRIAEDESAFRLTAVGVRYTGELTIARRACKRREAIEKELADDDTAAATTALAALEKLADDIQERRAATRELEEHLGLLRAAKAAQPFGHSGELGMQKLGRRRVAADEDRPEADLAVVDAAPLRRARRLVDRVIELHGEIAERLAGAQGADADALTRLGCRLLEADKPAEIAEIEQELGGPPAGRVRATLGMTAAGTPPRGISLRASVLGPGGARAGWSGDADDLFELEAVDAEEEVLWELGDGTGSFTGPARLRHRFGGDGAEIAVAASADGTSATGTAQVARPGRAATAARAFAVRDRDMTLVAGALAVGSGLLALYFAGDVWGLPEDYLKALLWGGTVAEGVRLVAQLVSRTWGATES